MRTTYRIAALAAVPVAAFLAAAPAARAQAPSTPTSVSTTAELAAICLPDAAGVQRLEAIAYCQGYVTAFGQYHTMMHPAGSRRAQLYCLPNPTPSVAEAAIAFANWAKQNPQYGNAPAPEGLLRWAQATYACPGTAAQPASRNAR
ncbi:Rap1a/Tai family immunity protein [Roseomonas xinghualingensis]|uniref:Rap1a/Tai family immunity protein n=1 Tax=Roseomonas xinghualingensis TaxID=2986475 RepID=UPI0021F0F6CD|nr:Rap1a/Tai family immunity protein [Roseomonas sp. SXEYE001]MCV4205874.1 Rap1a/Tai family immunity protein [Roseomonas sp. SXEYE001]